MNSKGTASKIGSAALVIGAAILLFLAQSAYWINHTVFDQQNFSQITTAALLKESSREAIAGAVVDKALADRPVAKRVLGSRLESLVSGLLGTDLSTQAITTLTSKTYAYATAPNREDIAIDLTGIKDPLNSLVNVVQSVQNVRGVESESKLETAQAKIPDQIVLISSNAFPDISGAVQTMLWLGPLLWLGSFIGFGLYIYLGRDQYAKKVYLAGLAIILVSLFGLATTPFIPPPIAAAVKNIALRPVAETLASGFLAPFAEQMYIMLGVVLLLLLLFNQRFNIMKLVHSLETKLSRQPKTDTKPQTVAKSVKKIRAATKPKTKVKKIAAKKLTT